MWKNCRLSMAMDLDCWQKSSSKNMDSQTLLQDCQLNEAFRDDKIGGTHRGKLVTIKVGCRNHRNGYNWIKMRNVFSFSAVQLWAPLSYYKMSQVAGCIAYLVLPHCLNPFHYSLWLSFKLGMSWEKQHGPVVPIPLTRGARGINVTNQTWWSIKCTPNCFRLFLFPPFFFFL